MGIKEILMRRDGMSEEDAKETIARAQQDLNQRIQSGDYFSAMDICEEYFGLEPDYLDELIF